MREASVQGKGVLTVIHDRTDRAKFRIPRWEGPEMAAVRSDTNLRFTSHIFANKQHVSTIDFRLPLGWGAAAPQTPRVGWMPPPNLWSNTITYTYYIETDVTRRSNAPPGRSFASAGLGSQRRPRSRGRSIRLHSRSWDGAQEVVCPSMFDRLPPSLPPNCLRMPMHAAPC